MNRLTFLACILTLTINPILTWHEVAKCTSSQTDPFTNERIFTTPNTLDLNCGSGLIFIAWSHYGNRPKTQPFLKSRDQPSTCYFSPGDCMVNVDYVANECNGMSNCKISLDSQYLHSCKSYSDYLFIIYECVDRKSTVDICDSDNLIEGSEIYLHTPNYPIEYSTNKDCSCSLQTSSDTQIELLEFDLESSFIEDPQAPAQSNTCTKDYLMIGNETEICSTLAPFSNYLQTVHSKQEIINFNFHSDDALTRRGFWIKIEPSEVTDCPVNFIRVKNVCVRIYNKLLTWYEAHNYCSGMGYSLAMIDDYELDKQLNNAVFDKNGGVSTLPRNKTFWTGMKHLNKTTWFDSKNEAIQFRSDEEKWWPWLVIDSTTYNKGSCVAKRANWLYLEDCYKRMPFACQYNQFKPKVSESKMKLKCGKDSGSYFQSLTTTTTTPRPTTTTQPPVVVTEKHNSIHSEKIVALSGQIKTLVDNEASSEDNMQFIDTDSSVLIGLVTSIAILIAFINTVVILFVCKRRKLMNIHKENDKSKSTSQDTMSSGHNINFDDITGAGSNSSSSLTFNPSTSIFFPIDNSQASRNTLFFAGTNTSKLQSGASSNSTILTTLNSAKKSFKKQPNSRHNNQDPLSHIYETISVTSASNCNLNHNTRHNNHYNLLNYYHLHQNSQANTYNDVECDFDPSPNANYNDVSLTDSSGSQKSHDYFIDPRRSLMQKNIWLSQGQNKILQQQIQPHQFNERNTNRFSDLNLSSTNTSQSPSSTTTTVTDYINPHTGQFTQQQFLMSHQNTLPSNSFNQRMCQGFNNNCPEQTSSAFTQLKGNMGRSSFKCLNNGLSQHDLNTGRFNQPQQQHNNLVLNDSSQFNFLTNQIEAVV